MAKVHECTYRLCHTLIPINNRYCNQHSYLDKDRAKYRNKQYNKYYRNQEANSFYQSKAWKQMRKHVVITHNYTSQVSGRILSDKDIIVDHIIPRRVDKTKELLTDNLWLLSRQEHNIKTHIEDKILAKPNGKNIITHLDITWWIKAIREQLNKTSKGNH